MSHESRMHFFPLILGIKPRALPMLYDLAASLPLFCPIFDPGCNCPCSEEFDYSVLCSGRPHFQLPDQGAFLSPNERHIHISFFVRCSQLKGWAFLISTCYPRPKQGRGQWSLPRNLTWLVGFISCSSCVHPYPTPSWRFLSPPPSCALACANLRFPPHRPSFSH